MLSRDDFISRLLRYVSLSCLKGLITTWPFLSNNNGGKLQREVLGVDFLTVVKCIIRNVIDRPTKTAGKGIRKTPKMPEATKAQPRANTGRPNTKVVSGHGQSKLFGPETDPILLLILFFFFLLLGRRSSTKHSRRT